jgi:putative thiamine transport system permease protein
MTSSIMRWAGFLPLGVLWILPLLLGLRASFVAALVGAGWVSLFSHPQFWPALKLSLVTGTLSLVISAIIAFLIVAAFYQSVAWQRLQGLMGGFLALPHLAFAVGLGFLIMPSGLLARMIGLVMGWADPPQWITTQDPYGMSLVAALVLKEVPFLIWLIASLLGRTDFAQMLQGHWRIGQSLGHGNASIWLKLFIPQILPRLKWPLLVVWVYGASVVDMALVIGPTQPPTLAVIIWSDLNNVDLAINDRGTAGAWLLTATLAVIAVAVHGGLTFATTLFKSFYSRGPGHGNISLTTGLALLIGLAAIYGLVLLVLGIMSIGALWPYPSLLPTQSRFAAWEQAISSPQPLLNSLSFAGAASIAALAMAIVWLETMAEKRDRYLLVLAVAALALPALLIADGQYLAFLEVGLTGHWSGVFLAHLTPVFAYAFVVLKGPYRAFDPRYRSVSLGLNTSALRFLFAVKLPLMKPVLASTLAIGIGVGIAQYVPVQLIASGRIPTLTVEAVTLASGGNRQLLAVYSLMLALVPLIAFIAAVRFGRRLA